ncbi:sugar transporter [Faecalimonas sp.]
MLITNENIKEYADRPAVFAIKITAGTEIAVEHLEHPMFLDDMVSSNLFTLDKTLTIGQVIGVKVAKDCDAFTPVTEDIVGGVVKLTKKEEPVEEKIQEVQTETTEQDGNTIIISIKEGKDIYLELPL